VSRLSARRASYFDQFATSRTAVPPRQSPTQLSAISICLQRRDNDHQRRFSLPFTPHDRKLSYKYQNLHLAVKVNSKPVKVTRFSARRHRYSVCLSVTLVSHIKMVQDIEMGLHRTIRCCLRILQGRPEQRCNCFMAFFHQMRPVSNQPAKLADSLRRDKSAAERHDAKTGSHQTWNWVTLTR